MNVKSLAPVFNLTDTQAATPAKEVKTFSGDNEKDADGKRHDQQHEEQKHLTEEEIEKALDYLKSLDGIKKNQLQVSVKENGAFRAFILTDPNGQVVRRIPEYEMLDLITHDQERKTGQIFDKAM